MGAHFFLPTQLTYRLANALVDVVVGTLSRGDGCKKPGLFVLLVYGYASSSGPRFYAV